MKVDFLQPRFDGARFNEHTLPLEVAKDLAAYETLVVELAKRLYLQDHTERQRVPKGFGADFHLHLERIDEGSAKPMLAVVAAAALALGDGGNTYFERARELITQCIGAVDGVLPGEFPSDLLVYFNQIGRSLRPDETIEFPGADQSVARLTPESRKKLVLAASQVYERPVELSGSIIEANWEKSTFQMRLTDGTVCTVPMPESFHSQARNFGGKLRDQVTVKGIANYDGWDRLQKVVSVDALEIQQNFQIATRLDEIRSLHNGWYDGAGIALNSEALDQIASRLIDHYPESLELPAIVPTPEGNLLLEWHTEGEPSVDITLSDMKAEFHAFRNGADVEATFMLSESNGWQQLFAILSQNIQNQSA